MTGHGHIVRWQAQRGFGFIAPAGGGQQLFFHVRDFRGTEPAEGLAVRFEQIDVGGKGPRAVAVQPLANGRPGAANASGLPAAHRIAAPPQPGRPAAPARSGGSGKGAGRQPRPAHHPRAADRARRGLDGQPALFALALLAWIGLLGGITWRGLWPVSAPAVLGGLALLNLSTFFAYAFDKSAAEQGRRRTPENTLHLLALLGGWPAAWWAQRALRHKSRKQPFLATYVATALLNLGALAALLWRAG